MIELPGSWQGFVYAEDRDGARSLGFKLLAPTNAPWSGEVETLARRMQACPYPETWQPAELFCSVLLEGGQRLVAIARYGLRDHTPSQRLGGLELLGAIGPATIAPQDARALAQWLREWRGATDDPRSLAGPLTLDNLPPAPIASPSDFLALHLPSAGVLLLTGTAPEQPDQNLGILEIAAAESWQWLPYCGPDFPFEAHAARGPLIAWLPPRVDLAVVLARPAPQATSMPVSQQGVGVWPIALILLAALVLNAAAWWTLPGRLPAPEALPAPKVVVPPAALATESRERFAKALYRLAVSRSGGDWKKQEAAFRMQYELLVAKDPDLRCDAESGQVLVGLVSQMAGYHPERVAHIIREEFKDVKGFDPEWMQLVSARVKLRLEREISGSK